VSISFQGKSLEEIAGVVDREGEQGADLIALPEIWRGQSHNPEPLEGPTVTTLAALARKHRAYIVCPIDRMAGQQHVNSAVLLDRIAAIAAVYDKLYPYWAEFDLRRPVEPGHDVCVCTTDFGRVGMAICFDVNFPEVLAALADQGAELVIWPSAYSAGTTLHAHTLMRHYYIVTATYKAGTVPRSRRGKVRTGAHWIEPGYVSRHVDGAVPRPCSASRSGKRVAPSVPRF
jgi:predicted amidohydrolase